jgi:hypothetical protein
MQVQSVKNGVRYTSWPKENAPTPKDERVLSDQ